MASADVCTLCGATGTLPRAWLCLRCGAPIGACSACVKARPHAATIAIESTHQRAGCEAAA